MMLETRPDDPNLVLIALFSIIFVFQVMSTLEQKNIIPTGPSLIESLYINDRRRWMATVLPTTAAAVCALWLGLRAFLPVNPDLYRGISYAIWGAIFTMSFLQLIIAKRAIKENRDIVKEHILKAEATLKRLAEGPVLLDEKLDAELMEARMQLIKVKEAMKLTDPNPGEHQPEP